eukprot:1023310-Amphidinium_carterae.1
MQTIEKDQGPFDETMLELLGLESAAARGIPYDSACVKYLFPHATGHHEVARYAACWWNASE